ncbi:hypothetical protein QZH41_001495 [Actinostola sp. cb2023]|nr:hypothetical protein QZH41_001495 [Actinostola sp. cb2023]
METNDTTTEREESLVVKDTRNSIIRCDDAVVYGKKCVDIARENSDKQAEKVAYLTLIAAFISLNQHDDVVVYGKKCLELAKETGDNETEEIAHLAMAEACILLNRYNDAISYCEKCLVIAQSICDREVEMEAYLKLEKAYASTNQHQLAILYGNKCIDISKETGDKDVEMKACVIVGNAYRSLNQYDDAISYCSKSIEIAKETGDKQAELQAYLVLGLASCNDIDAEKTRNDMNSNLDMMRLCTTVHQYEPAILSGKKCLDIAKTIKDKKAEMDACLGVGEALFFLSQHDEAIAYVERAVVIAKETGSRLGELKAYNLLAASYVFLKQYDKLISVTTMAIDIAEETGDKQAETEACLAVGSAHKALNQYDDAIVYSKRCVKIAKEIEDTEIAIETGDQTAEMNAYLRGGDVLNLLNQYNDAVVYFKKCLDIATTIRDKKTEMDACLGAGEALVLLDQHGDARDYIEKAVLLEKETGNIQSEMKLRYLKLAEAYFSLNQYDDVIFYSQKCIAIAATTADKKTEGSACLKLGRALFNLKQYDDAIHNLNRSLAIAEETHNKHAEMEACSALGMTYASLKQFDHAIVFHQKCLEISKVTGDETREVTMHLLILHYHVRLHKIDGVFRWSAASMRMKEKLDIFDLVWIEHNWDFRRSASARDWYDHISTFEAEVAQAEKDQDNIRRLVALRLLSVRHELDKQYDKATECLTQILDIDLEQFQSLKNACCHQEIARYYELQSNINKAIEHYELALPYTEKCISKYFPFLCLKSLGTLYFQQRELDKAIRMLEQCVTCADLYLKQLSHDKGIMPFPDDHKMDIFHAMVSCHKMLSEALIQTGNHKEALLRLEHCRGRILMERLIVKSGMELDHDHATSEISNLHLADIESLVSVNKYSIVFYFVGSKSLHTFFAEDEKEMQLSTQNLENCEENHPVACRTVIS